MYSNGGTGLRLIKYREYDVVIKMMVMHIMEQQENVYAIISSLKRMQIVPYNCYDAKKSYM